MLRNLPFTTLFILFCGLFTCSQVQAQELIQGVNTAGAVKVNSLACLEALVNIACNGFELAGIVIGFFFLMRSLGLQNRSLKTRNYALAAFFIIGGLQLPSTAIWLIEAARNINLFS